MPVDSSASDGSLLWQQVEGTAVTYVRSLGFDAEATPGGADGGLDVVGAEIAGQVKAHASAVGRPDVQRLRGAAHGHQHAVFFSISGYTPNAVSFADDAGVALFNVHSDLSVRPANDLAAALATRPGQPRVATTAARRGPELADAARIRPDIPWAKVAASMGVFAALVLLAPVGYPMALEARERAGEQTLSGPGHSRAAKWRFWTMLIGGLGVVGYIGAAATGIGVLVTGRPSDDPGLSSIATAVAFIVGVPVVVLIHHQMRRERVGARWRLPSLLIDDLDTRPPF